jgi:hypothetical protein
MSTLRADTIFSRRVVRECLSEELGKGVEQVAKESGFSITTCRRILRELHAEKIVHVFDWHQRTSASETALGGLPAALYALGDKPDAKRPPRTPKSVSNARYNAKLAVVIRAKARHKEGKYTMFDQLRCA